MLEAKWFGQFGEAAWTPFSAQFRVFQAVATHVYLGWPYVWLNLVGSCCALMQIALRTAQWIIWFSAHTLNFLTWTYSWVLKICWLFEFAFGAWHYPRLGRISIVEATNLTHSVATNWFHYFWIRCQHLVQTVQPFSENSSAGRKVNWQHTIFGNNLVQS